MTILRNWAVFSLLVLLGLPVWAAEPGGNPQTVPSPTNAVHGATTPTTLPPSPASDLAKDGKAQAVSASKITARPTDYKIDNRLVTGIEKVRFDPKSGRVVLLWKGGGGAYPNQKFSDEFLTQWGVDIAPIKAANERAKADRDRQEKARLDGEQLKDDEMRVGKEERVKQSESDRAYLEQERAKLRAKVSDPAWRSAQIAAMKAKYRAAGGAMATLANDDAFLNQKLEDAVIDVLAQSRFLSADYVRRMGGLGGF